MAYKELPDRLIDTKNDRATGIRIPRELHQKINLRAEANYRTFNSMIIALLHDAMNKPETEVMFLRMYRKILELEKIINSLTEVLKTKETSK